MCMCVWERIFLLLPQFAMTEGHISWVVTESLFATYCWDSSLWLKPTVFEMSQRGYMQPITATVQYGWRTQYLRCHKESICDILLTQFIMTEAHSIWDVTKSLFATYCCTETVHYDWWQQYLICHREAICNLLQPKFNMAEGHSIWEVTERLYATYCFHSSLWLKATIFDMSQRGYSSCSWRPPQFSVARGQRSLTINNQQINMTKTMTS